MRKKIKGFNKRLKNRSTRIKNMKQLIENHVEYQYSFKDGKMVLAVDDSRLINPRLICEHGDINADIKQDGSTVTFSFGIDELPHIDAVSSKLLIEDEELIYNFMSYRHTGAENYARVYDILYGEEFVYYLRNTASKAGRLLLQKKVRAHFENEEYGERVEKIYQETRGQKLDKVIFYEKFGSKFEESASKIFEKTAHLPNVYFVLDRTSDQYEEIKAKYGDRILSPDEDQFLRILFTARYYIGTEVPFHMVTLRTPYPRFRQEIMKTQKHRFIFLQHGVMYALSLKPNSRNSFKKNGIHAPFRIVASSEAEAEHLKDLGAYKNKDIWKTGLATFDGKQINADADKISLMLTWRPWDEQKDSFEETTYYQAVKSIVDSIEDKSKLQIILHPKVLETINEDNEILKYKYDGLINDALNDTKVLISDYSSVTFDAFYRGINVVFWWNQKNECLQAYDNDLMLTYDNTFGDVVNDNRMLNTVLEFNYNNPQQERYQERFKKIVEFDDNCNTERIIEFMYTETVFNQDLELTKIQEIRDLMKFIEPNSANYGRLKMAYNNRLDLKRAEALQSEIKHEILYQLILEVAKVTDITAKNKIIDSYKSQLKEYISTYQAELDLIQRYEIEMHLNRKEQSSLKRQFEKMERRTLNAENRMIGIEEETE